MVLPFFVQQFTNLFHKRQAKQPEEVEIRIFRFTGRHMSMGYEFGRHYRAHIEPGKKQKVWFMPEQKNCPPVLYDNIELLRRNWKAE